MRHASARPGRSRQRSQRLPLAVASVIALALTAGVIVFAIHWTGSSLPAPAGPGQAHQAQAGPAASHAATPAPSPNPPAPAQPRLSAEQLAGQRVIYSYPGLTPPASLLRWIRHGEVGGVIFFSGNVASSTQLARVVAELDRANASRQNPMRSYPLLLMSDQEGGEVRRLPGAPDLSEAQIGQSTDPAAEATAAGTGAGRNLRGVGLNVNLAPVLDVYRTAGDFDDQAGRSYSTDSRQVSRLGADFIRAQQAQHVAATAKHFPGLGAASSAQDTDLRPVTLPLTTGELRGTDEYPYHAAIAAGVKLVMVSWAVYPALDPRRPAGLSPAIVGGDLRKRLGFTGVTITDALEAGALQPFGTIGTRATLAARAGMDLILCSAQQDTEGAQARAALAAGYRSGKVSHGDFQSAVNRILALRASLRR
ncbi:MAG TPA: glycoside hydrolase family 3 N-terminal domain-containing protein [Streptosporangiaceae bacterium]